MKILELLTDPYDRQARLYPAIAALSPALLTALVLVPKLELSGGAVATFCSLGGVFLLSQIGRGSHKEPRLYQQWGGKPSVTIFRHSDCRIDQYTKKRYHNRMQMLVAETVAPSQDQEKADPGMADEIYTAWSTFLRENTRDKRKYDLIFKELTNYGYRRNLWALKPFGVSLAMLLILAAFCFMKHPALAGMIKVSAGIFAINVSVVVLFVWIFVITPNWVRIAANAYAKALSASCDTFQAAAPKPPRKSRAPKDKQS